MDTYLLVQAQKKKPVDPAQNPLSFRFSIMSWQQCNAEQKTQAVLLSLPVFFTAGLQRKVR